ncbi:ABC transporter substrate-binding protein [Conexibacter woesei]|uniref:Extracellular solute-binding protein family 5 n=1 Tax=Conexibacter woesei (strain DSM 14684 / CCUG 47730 / CIP 108061 / JCM 11494 / NBRC 100937 / ID131577) TaxID=469383 RepID=D3FDD8_CONWI|nr:ABC transporter substrate-binding protein [Conexibacter woesei]ADB53530.1 extracellular solute-binding protein family 5 [Conexibacter woesei DSM 14684]
MRVQIRHLAVLAAGCAVLAGCGGGGSTSGGETGDTAASTQAARAGGRLVYGTAAGISQLDPHTLSAAQQLVVQPLLFNGLTKADPSGETTPDLAASWRASADQRTWTFTLRDGVRFHDGTPFDAAAAKANLERVLDPRVPNPDRTKIETIAKIETPAPTTLVLKLRAPNALLPDALASGTIKMIAPRSFSSASKTAVGTGPFKLGEMVPDDHVTLLRNDGYWGEPAKLDEIDVVRSPDSTAAATAFRAGDLDVLWAVTPADVDGLVAATRGRALEPDDVSAGAYWEVDNTSPPFDDVRARQALLHAIDRETMLKVGYAGKGLVPETASMLSPRNAAFDSSLTTYPFDLDKARALFAEAGVDAGTTLTFHTVAGQYPEWVQMGQILQQNLEEIGIRMKIERQEFSTWLDTFYPAGKRFPGGIVANYLSLPTVPSYALSFLDEGVCECNARLPGWRELSARAVATGEQAERDAIYAEMQQLQNDAVPIMPIVFSTLQTVVRDGVTGAWVDPQGNVNLEQAGFAP